MKLIEEVNAKIRIAAFDADEKKAQSILDEGQKAWDAGESFISTEDWLEDVFRKRTEDSAEEIRAAVLQTEASLKTAIVEGRLKAMSRDEVKAMLNGMISVNPDAGMYLYGQKWSASDLAQIWNKQHPGEQELIRTADWAI